LKKQKVGLEQQALETMMKSHFIFNAMNSIQYFVNVNDKKSANQYLADFAKLIRMNLDISSRNFISIEDEISFLQLYLSFEKLRFGTNLTYDIIVDPNIDPSETRIAVMMIQPFVENAIWHGILPMNEVGEVCIQIEAVEEDFLRIIIEDNGIGIGDKFLKTNLLFEKIESHGIGSIIGRLMLLNKSSDSQLNILYKHLNPNSKNKGTRVEILLPSMY